MARLGYPVRVVEPPVWGTTEPPGYCTWSVYKDPPLVPAEAYRRVGTIKPKTEAMALIEAVDLVPTHQVVTERLRHAIHIGTYLPGDKLPPERALAQQLGVSRMTVREAIRVLRTEGYVSSRRGSTGGITVLDQAEDEMRLRQVLRHRMAELDDDFEFRIAVEGAAARLAAQRRTKHDLARLREAYLELEQGPETARFRAADNVFHLAIADAARNKFMRQAIENVRAMTGVPLDQVISRVFTSAHEHHAQILQAIEDRDPDAAERAVVAHIRRAQRDLRRVAE
jgi:GntR family transcriptional regulator, transcriptional repressor for pyruvate dehydrogenase complex